MDTAIDVNKLANDCMRGIQEVFKNLDRLNIMVVGKTGVGKSTLINSIFRKPLAETGVGDKKTTHIYEYSLANFPLHIFDTVGLELNESTRKVATEEIVALITKRARSGKISDFIHCIWYCINAASNRFETEEQAFLNDISNCVQGSKTEVIIVLTQAYSKKETTKFIKYIEGLRLDVAKIIPLVAKDYEMDDDMIRHPYVMEDLVSSTVQVLPESLKDTFVSIQKASLKEKESLASNYVHGFALASFGEAALPLPFSDISLWIPTEVTMIAKITMIYGLEIKKSILTSLISCLLGSGGTYVATSTVANFLKFIPGLGTVVGGLINGSVGIALTEALGHFYIAILSGIVKGEIKESELYTTENILRLMKKYKW